MAGIPEIVARYDGLLTWDDVRRLGWPRMGALYLTATAARRVVESAHLIGRERLRCGWRMSREAIARELMFCGDASIERAVVGVVTTLPPPVQVWALEHAAFVGVGVATNGWCSRLPLGHGTTERRVIALAVVDESVIAHEIGHLLLDEAGEAWRPAGSEIAGIGADERAVARCADVLSDARTVDEFDTWLLAAAEREMKAERQAATFARECGFSGRAADPSFAAQVKRREFYSRFEPLRAKLRAATEATR